MKGLDLLSYNQGNNEAFKMFKIVTFRCRGWRDCDQVGPKMGISNQEDSRK